MSYANFIVVSVRDGLTVGLNGHEFMRREGMNRHQWAIVPHQKSEELATLTKLNNYGDNGYTLDSLYPRHRAQQVFVDPREIHPETLQEFVSYPEFDTQGEDVTQSLDVLFEALDALSEGNESTLLDPETVKLMSLTLTAVHNEINKRLGFN